VGCLLGTSLTYYLSHLLLDEESVSIVPPATTLTAAAVETPATPAAVAVSIVPPDTTLTAAAVETPATPAAVVETPTQAAVETPAAAVAAETAAAVAAETAAAVETHAVTSPTVLKRKAVQKVIPCAQLTLMYSKQC
jgi:hypothetical protein